MLARWGDFEKNPSIVIVCVCSFRELNLWFYILIYIFEYFMIVLAQLGTFLLVVTLLPIMATASRSAAVLGATGAVGQEVIRALLERGWGEVHLLSRRDPDVLDADDDKRVVHHVVPMLEGDVGGPLETHCATILTEHSVDAVFVTMGVGAPSQFKGEEGAAHLTRVDVTLPTACARGARASGSVKHFSILTAVNADVNAQPDTSDRLFGLLSRARAGGGLYNHCKGQVEENIRALKFPTFSTFRPAALLGTPNTPKSVAFIFGLIDPILPALWKCSPIATLGNAMVLDAEEKLDAASAAEGDISASAKFDVFEGTSLHALYARTKGDARAAGAASGRSGL